MSQVGEKPDAPEVEDVEAPETETPEAEAEDEGDEADGDEAEGDEEVDDAGGEAPPAVAAKPRSAATVAVQEAKRAAKEAKAEAEATRRELNELRQAAQGRQTEEQRRVEAERLSLMPPEEKFEYLLNKQKQDFEARLGQVQFQTNDSADRTAFESLCARNPAFAAVRDDVESKIPELRRNGGNTTREVMATYLIGQRALERAAKGGKSKQAAKGAAKVASAAARPVGGRSDIRGGERRETDDRAARAKRLDGMEI